MGAARIIFITGTGTGAGKTRLTSSWVRHLFGRGIPAAAVKPLASGGRDDAVALREAQAGRLSLDEINPWHFRAALTPLIAAQRAGVEVSFDEVFGFCRRSGKGQEVLLVEGAGGLLSPLGPGFDAPDLIRRLHAGVVIAGWNRLGVLNEIRLTLDRLPSATRARAMVCLAAPGRPDPSRISNLEYLRELLGAGRVVEMPFERRPRDRSSVRVTAALRALTAGMGLAVSDR